MRYFDFILNEGYPEAQKEFAAASGDPNLSSEVIGQYRTLVNRNQVQGNERNIDWWRKQGWESFSKFVAQKLQQPSKTQVKRKKVAGRSITLMESDKWLIVIPLDKEASCFHGKDSSWCTTKQHQPYFENYFYDREVTLIYCLNKQTGGMWAIAAHRKLEGRWEIFNQQDISISDSRFFSETQLDVKRIVDVALSDTHQPEVQKSRVTYKDAVAAADALFVEWTNTPRKERPVRNAELEKQLVFIKEQKLCYKYVNEVATTAMANIQPNHKNSPPGYYGLGTIDATQFPEEIAIPAILYDPRAYKFFTNQTERMAMAVVQEDGLDIALIDNPSVKVQIAAIERDENAINYIENIAPEVLERFPELKNSLTVMSDEQYEKFLPQVHDLIQGAMDEEIYDWQDRDEYFTQWQAEQAREMGYLLFPDGTPYEGEPDELQDVLDEREVDIGDMEVDWDRVHDDDELSDYLEYSYDAKGFVGDVTKVLNELTPDNFRSLTKEYIEQEGGDQYLGVGSVEYIIAWKLKEIGQDYFADTIKEKLSVRRTQDGTYRVSMR